MKKGLLILLCLPMIGFGQGWEVTLGGSSSDMGLSVQQTIDDGYIITGMTYSFGGGTPDVYLVKTDANGVEQWFNTFTGFSGGGDYGNSVKQTMDGGYIITGYAMIDNLSVSGHLDLYLIKTDGIGVEQWSRAFGGNSNDAGHSVQQTTDGGYIITGYTWSNGSKDIWLIKTDGNGQEQWSQTFVGSYDMNGSSVQQTSDGGYIIAGACDCPDDGILIKTDGNGIEQWSQNLGGTGNSVQQTTDGGYVIAGKSDLIALWDFWLSKTDGNGQEQWSQTYGGWSASSVQQTSDGGYIITGYTLSNGYSDVYLVKTDGSGIEQWNQTFGGSLDYDIGSSVQQTTDGGYIIAGYTDSFGNGGDVYLIKTDGNGNVTSTFNIPINPNRKLEKEVDILGRETKQTNQPLLYIYDDGTVEKRIIIE
jgi:hypothetical protein